MTIIIPIPSLIAGLIAGLLYYAFHAGAIVGVTAPFLPIFVLALSGMSYGRAGIMVAAAATTPILLLSLPIYDAMLIIFSQLVPLTAFIRKLMTATWTNDPPTLWWSSPAFAISALTLFGAAFYAALVGSNNEFYKAINSEMLGEIRRGFSTLDPKMAASMETLIQLIPHLLLAMNFWVWSLIVYAVVSFANKVIWAFGYGRREHMQIRAHTPPNTMLAALGLCALVGTMGSNSIAHAGQAASIILLIPYFFSGLGYIHSKIYAKPHAQAWMIGFYVLLFLFNLWPLLGVTVLGLARHAGRYTLLTSHPQK